MGRSKRGPITAGELIEELKNDFAYRRAQAERDRKAAEETKAIRVLEQAALEHVRRVLPHALSIRDMLVSQGGKLQPAIVNALRGALREITGDDSTSRAMREELVRSLCGAVEEYPGDELVALFDETANELLRWAIANTLAESPAQVSADWLAARIDDPASGRAREMLLLAAARHLPRDTSIPLLRKHFAEFPGHAAMALGRVGGPSEREFLLSQSDPKMMTWVRKEIEKAVRRLGRPKPRQRSR